ncbi:hypothetical protein [Vallicoccus soli]|uniref:Uncharacterized protein n=1 Tax=Vallicoccus soli TaxID=2339232 RepID=A0A3A3Z0E2_9ACTN|nr:hypothetical protein [Vallicoccus soli]RJK94922.1 hypothetical protein D5H78_14125 [Vallicoccus soli]
MAYGESLRHVDLVLDRPLGGRVLLDPHGRALPVLPAGDPLLQPPAPEPRRRTAPQAGWPRQGGASSGSGW